MADTQVTVGEPKHGSKTEPAAKRNAPDNEPRASSREQGRPAEISLHMMTESERDEWQRTGELPGDLPERKQRPSDWVDTRDEDFRSGLATGDEELNRMTLEERQEYLRTGGKPQEAAPRAEKEAAPESTTRTEVATESQPHPETKGEHVLLGPIDNVTHTKAKESLPQRYASARDSDPEAQKIIEESATIPLAPALARFLIEPMAHMQHPWAFYREFVRNAQFRQEIERSDVNGIIRIMADFDGGKRSAPAQKAPEKATKAPAPARSVSGKATAPPDEAEAALKSGNFRTWMRAENENEARRWKASRHAR